MTTRRSKEGDRIRPTVKAAASISGSGVDADPRTKFMININFNSPAAFAVWSNNR